MSVSQGVRKNRNHLNGHSRSTTKIRQSLRRASPLVPVGDREGKLAQAGDLETLESAWYVGRRRPLSDLPFWKRWLVRAVYFTVGWCTGDGIEAQAICTSKELAEEMAKQDGWFFHELPINTPLPGETCRFRAHVFPSSDARGKYEAMRLPLGAVRLSTIQEAERKVEQIIRSASA
jgi:hypothetical protein